MRYLFNYHAVRIGKWQYLNSDVVKKSDEAMGIIYGLRTRRVPSDIVEHPATAYNLKTNVPDKERSDHGGKEIVVVKNEKEKSTHKYRVPSILILFTY